MALGGSGGGGGGSASAVRAGQAYVEMKLDDSGVNAALQRLNAKFQAFAARTATVGAGLIGVGAAIAAPILQSFSAIVERGDALGEAATRLGTTTEILSTLGYAAGLAGQDIGGLEANLGKLQLNLQEARSGSGPAAEALAKLGLSAEDLAGMSLDEKVAEIAEGLNGISDPGEKAAAGMALFGKSFRSMFPLLKGGKDGLAQLRKEAEMVGAVMSEDDKNKSDTIADSMQRTQLALKYGWESIGAALLPLADTIDSVSRAIVGIVASVRTWVRNNGALILGVLAVAAVLVGLGTAAVVAAGAISAAGAVLAAVGAVITFVSSPLGVLVLSITAIVAALAILGYAWVTQTEAGRTFAEGIGAYFGQTFANVSRAVEGITTLLAQGEMEKAWEAALLTMSLEFVRFAALIVRGQDMIFKPLIDGWHSAVYLLKGLWIDFGEWLGTSLVAALKGALEKFEVQFRAVAGLLANLFAFDAALSKSLTAISAAPKDSLLRGFDGANQRIKDEAQEARNKAQADLEREQEKSFLGRFADELDVMGAAVAARLGMILPKRDRGAGGDWGSNADIDKLAGAGGSFDISDWSGQFGIRMIGPVQEQVNEQKKTNEKLDKLIEKTKPPAFGP